jgi:ketosteroid isomerase-like protein
MRCRHRAEAVSSSPVPDWVIEVFGRIAGVDATKVPEEQFEAILHPDVEWDVTDLAGIPDEAAWRGREEVIRGWYRWLEQWDDYRMTFENMTRCGDYVVVDARAEARGRTSGVPVAIDQVQAASWKDGKLYRLRGFPDRETALEQLRDAAE